VAGKGDEKKKNDLNVTDVPPEQTPSGLRGNSLQKKKNKNSSQEVERKYRREN